MNFSKVTIFYFLTFFIYSVLATQDDSNYGDDYYNDLDEYYTEEHDENDKSSYRCPGTFKMVSLDFLCDDFADCEDESDEDVMVCAEYLPTTSTVPPPTTTPLSTTSTIRTTTTTILNKLRMMEKEDQDYSEYGECMEDEFQCSLDIGLCIPMISVCDGVSDCSDGSDEARCDFDIIIPPLKTETKGGSTLSGVTTTVTKQPNKTFHDVTTLSHTDLAMQDTTTVATLGQSTGAVHCADDEFQCNKGTDDCIPLNLVCDGFSDCQSESDEIDCGGNEDNEIIKPHVHVPHESSGGHILTTTVPTLLEKLTTRSKRQRFTEAATTAHSTVSKNEESFHICSTNICRNGGFCTLLDDFDFKCICKPGYKGTLCQLKVCEDEAVCGKHNSSNLLSSNILTLFVIQLLLTIVFL